MPAVTIDLKSEEDRRDVVHRAVEALSAGKIIAIPTETVYGLAASALHPQAVERLFEIKGRDKSSPLAYAVKSLDEDVNHPDSVIHRLDPIIQESTIPTGTVGLRVPAHETTLQIMRMCAGPIVLTSANLSGQPDAIDGQQVNQSVGDQIDLILDDGPTNFGKPSSVIKVDEGGISMLREGVVDEATIKKLKSFIALIVCTGNTCRSPMGEGLLRKRLANKLGCPIETLEQQGVSILSAGIAAMPGSPAAAQAVEVMNLLGVDISSHASQPITGRLAQFADVILTMTNGHRQALISHWPTLETRTKTVRRDGADVGDPIGAPVDVYQACAQQIDENLAKWVDEFDLS